MIKSRKVSMYIVVIVIVISIFGLAFSCQQTTRTEVEDFTPYVQTTTTELQKIIKLADRVIFLIVRNPRSITIVSKSNGFGLTLGRPNL